MRSPTYRRATSSTWLVNLKRRTANFLDEASPPPGDALPRQAALRWVQISPPEFEGPLGVALRGVMIVNGQVGHRETVCHTRDAFHDAVDTTRLDLLAEPVDELTGGCSIDLGEREVNLPFHAREIVVRRIGLVA